jgi:hypothetical protein
MACATACAKQARTGRKYAGYYSERIHVEAAVLAGRMVHNGRIGRVIQVIGLGPHRASPEKRPAWFFDRRRSGFEDFGDAALVGDNGATHCFRVDWFTPEGLSTWGDGRTFILGTEGYLELRKYLDVATSREGDCVFLVDREGEHHVRAGGTVGFPFFGDLIRDCLERNETAYSPESFFKAIDLAIDAREQALCVE